MDTQTATTQEQSAASDTPATAASDTITTPDTTSSTPDTFEETSREFMAKFSPPEESDVSEETETTEEQAQPAETPVAEETPDTQEAEAPEDKDDPKAPEQMRPRLHDPEDIAIAALAKARGIKLSEAAAIIAGTAKQPPIPGIDEHPAVSPANAAITELEGEIATLAAEMKAAREGEDYLTPEYMEKQEQLSDKRADLKIAKLQQQQETTAREREASDAETRTFNDALDTARKTYPSIGVVGSQLNKNSDAIIAEYQASADPRIRARLNQPDVLAADAVDRTATELFRAGKFPTVDKAIASLKADAPKPDAPAPLSSPTPAQPAARRVAAASGSKGSVAAKTPSTIGEVFANINTADEGNKALAAIFDGPAQGHRRGS